jgi:Winged helix-turn helix
MQRMELDLTAEEQDALIAMRDHHPKPYMRERAAALLKVHGGTSALEVARRGVLKPRRPDTVRDWVHRYRQHGLGALRIRPGRGRPAAFSPSVGGGGTRGAAGRGASSAVGL